jgi:hypothetical protein
MKITKVRKYFLSLTSGMINLLLRRQIAGSTQYAISGRDVIG